MTDEQALTQVLGPWARSAAGVTNATASTFARALAGFVSDERRAGIFTDADALAFVAEAAEMYEDDPAKAASALTEALQQERRAHRP
jgi:O-acetyl-ADP-ribose deacetylase (regulator of RNase III)